MSVDTQPRTPISRTVRAVVTVIAWLAIFVVWLLVVLMLGSAMSQGVVGWPLVILGGAFAIAAAIIWRRNR